MSSGSDATGGHQPAMPGPAGTPVPAGTCASSGAAPAASLTASEARDAVIALETDRAVYLDSHRRSAEHIARAALEMGLVELHLRARLVLADMAIRRGEVLDAAQTIERIRAQAETIGASHALARSHFLLAMVTHSIGDSATARINGIRSVELLPDDIPSRILIDHLCMLGTAYGPGIDSQHCHDRALDLANAIGDSSKAIAIHNTLGYFAWQQSDVTTASKHAASMLELSRLRRIPLKTSEVDTLARVHMMYQNFEQAIHVLEPRLPGASQITAADAVQDLAVDDQDPKPYALPEAALTTAEAYRRLGDFVTAETYLAFAQSLARMRGLTITVARTLREQAASFAAREDFEQAYVAHRAYHDAVTATYSDEQEARAQLVQATFDEAETRRDVEQFRDLAMRDPLTGLYNRRFLDHQMTKLLERAAAAAQPLSVAIVDADFFKRVNDELSHAVGDTVLQQLATTLSLAMRPGEVVGRLGGEEFALIFPGLDGSRAAARCESVRLAVQDADWGPLTGAVPVTVSVGVSCSPDGTAAPSALLGHADRNLYAAKRSGRNRVMADPGSPVVHGAPPGGPGHTGPVGQ